MSTNKSGIGSVVLEVAIVCLRNSLQFELLYNQRIERLNLHVYSLMRWVTFGKLEFPTWN